jgi:hypothetical protein
MAEPTCDGCGRAERLASLWQRLLTRLTTCLLCGRSLCPNCFTDPCEVGGDHIDTEP